MRRSRKSSWEGEQWIVIGRKEIEEDENGD
jgi:hypothetical protein